MDLNTALNLGEQGVVPRGGKVYLCCKRIFDFTASLTGLILLSPLVALAIKIEDYKGKVRT